MSDKPNDISSAVVVRDVRDFVEMPGTGRVYRALITVATLAKLLRKSVVRYSPKYQRGFKKVEDDPNAYHVLLPITDKALQINRKRSEEMAVKYLTGALFSASLIWNARKDPAEPAPEYDPTTHDLKIFTEITIPDTAHRHLAHYILWEWSSDPKRVPTQVTVNDKAVPQAEIQKMLESFDPEKATIFLEIYNLAPQEEGFLYDQFNFDARAPQKAVGNALNPLKTPGRRFILDGLMRISPIFDETEIEMHSNNIGTDSRKLWTNNTLVGAADHFKKLLGQLEDENGKTGAHKDLQKFFANFFEEYAAHFPAVQAGASRELRMQTRNDTFAISNILIHPLFRIAKDLWMTYRFNKTDWTTATEWKDAVARLGKTISVKDESGNETFNGPVMSRKNPEWVGKILIEQYGPEGVTGTSVSNTSQTRNAAYGYLIEIMEVKTFITTS
ncbi:DNA sulfur modification protein DndB [Paenarthrobacter sp. NEAU-H11]|uniref:DNA sulfur modification protein DndB n=1 Tax=Paenarthrobacter sp. NEAU-H11 TaxID=3423924 RepID=UPI003D33E6F1